MADRPIDSGNENRRRNRAGSPRPWPKVGAEPNGYHASDLIHSHVRLHKVQASEFVASLEAFLSGSAGHGRGRGRRGLWHFCDGADHMPLVGSCVDCGHLIGCGLVPLTRTGVGFSAIRRDLAGNWQLFADPTR